MKNILVTGGAGFIGSNLCARLIADGHKVYVIDDYSTGSKENEVDGVGYIRCSTHAINNAFWGEFVPDTIFHLGEYSRVEKSFDDIDVVFSSNSAGTLAIIKYALKHNAKLIYAGSSTKFGDIGSDSSPYAFTKAQNTELVKNYGDWFGLKYAITYFYNAYGNNEISSGNYATLIARFCERTKEGKDLYVTSPGSQLRNFTHVDDIVDGLVLVGKSGIGDGYGIGSNESFSVLEIAEMFGGKIIMNPQKRGNRMGAELVTEKTRELGWSPKRNIISYIEKFKLDNNLLKKDSEEIRLDVVQVCPNISSRKDILWEVAYGKMEDIKRFLKKLKKYPDFFTVVTELSTEEFRTMSSNKKSNDKVAKYKVELWGPCGKWYIK